MLTLNTLHIQKNTMHQYIWHNSANPCQLGGLVFGCALPPSSPVTPLDNWDTQYSTSGVRDHPRSAVWTDAESESPHQARALMAELPDTDVLRAGMACHRRLRSVSDKPGQCAPLGRPTPGHRPAYIHPS
ncbi:unnamed protein product [Leuciscus chuanchicus]